MIVDGIAVACSSL